MRKVAFEEVLDEEPVVTDESPDGPRVDDGARTVDEAAPSHGAGLPRRARRRWVTAGVLVLVVAGGLLIGAQVEERRAADRLSGALGGLVPWGTEPPHELWSVDAPGGRYVAGGAAGLVLVDGATVSRVDLESGVLDWSREVGAGAACGTDLYWRVGAEGRDEPLVCVSAGDGRVATVLAEDGAVLGELALDGLIGDEAIVTPGPSGSVVLAERTGTPSTDVPPTTYQVPAQQGTVEVVVPAGRGVHLSVVDVLTGEVRWERDIEFVAAEGYPRGCVTSRPSEGDMDEESFSVETESVVAGSAAGMVQVDGCGVSSLFSADGTMLLAPGASQGGRLPDGAGGFLSFGGADETVTAFDASGTVRWEVPGTYLFPGATDGTVHGARLLTADGQVLAVDLRDGLPLWEATLTPDQVLVQTSEVVVLARASQWFGLDATTGRTLWEAPAATDQGFFSTFTDGEQFLVSSPVGEQSAGEAALMAYDLRTGERLWVQDGLAGEDQLVAFDGALLRLREGSVSRWG